MKRGRKTKPMEARPIVRCVIYTRTSSDERLHCDFNSLDAQREACEAYVRSQRANRWALNAEVYDDGGFSGKDTDRPALTRLLDDIRAGKIDAVILYKLDRISRSLFDFLRLIQFFEEHKVACVSISQTIDTSTPGGRLMMHVLASFAEFERATIAERIKDKIAASRRKGKWTGGTPVLGYDVNRSGPSPKLVINPTEAARVVQIFEMYVEMGALLPVVAELNRRDWRCKAWTTRLGKQRGGEAFDKARLYGLLINVLLMGKIRHKDNVFDGEHEAIVPAELFERVQRQMRKNARFTGAGHRNKHGALLRGILNCAACQRSMSHSFTSKGNRRFRYYRCMRALKSGRAACPSKMLPAAEIERAVIDEIRVNARDPGMIRETCRAARIHVETAIKRLERERRGLVARKHDAGAKARLTEIHTELSQQCADLVDEQYVVAAFADFDNLWAALTPREQAEVVHLLIARVEFDAADSSIEISFHPTGIKALADKMIANSEEAA